MASKKKKVGESSRRSGHKRKMEEEKEREFVAEMRKEDEKLQKQLTKLNESMVKHQCKKKCLINENNF